MAQAHSWSVLADPAFLQIVSLLEALDTPVAAVDCSGYILYESAAFSSVISSPNPDGDSHTLLRDWVVPTNLTAPPFLKSGALNFKALPYAGRCRIVTNLGGAESRDAIISLEPFRDTSGHVESAFCVLRPLPAATGEGEEAVSSSLRRWQPRVEEIGDSFDTERIGMKTRKLLADMTGASDTGFYWLNGDTWQRSGSSSDQESLPAALPAKEPWVSIVIRDSLLTFNSLARIAKSEGCGVLPPYLRKKGEGFAIACKARGDALALIFVWTDAFRWQSPSTLDLLNLVSFEAAQAVDYARWFQFARQSDARSEQFIDHANAIILGVDLRSNVTVWNRKAQEVFGFSREEVIGRSVSSMFAGPGEEAAAIHQRLDRVLNGKESFVGFGLKMRDKTGDFHEIEWNTSLLTSTQGAVLGFYAIGQDVTRRKELEQSLAVSERRYRSLVESTHDLYWSISFNGSADFEQGSFSFLNRAFAGLDPDLIVGRNVAALEEIFAPESWNRFREACEQVCRTEKPFQYLETEHLTAGEKRSQLFLISDIFPTYEDGVFVGIQGLSIDNTGHKKMEAQALQAQKLESIGTLAQGVSHDFNNILHGISGFSFLIQRSADNAEKVRANVRAIQELTDRASRLTRQLQTYANQASTEKRALDLNEVVRQSLNILNISVARHTKVEASLPNGLPWIQGDRSQIEQILLNLFINAAEAMGESGALTVSTRSVCHEQGGEGMPHDAPSGQYTVLTVRDTGSGMSPEVRDRIFDPFFTTKRTGHGLGLYSVFGIIKRHDAFIQVESEVGVGTCFTIAFPAIEESRQLLGAGPDLAVCGGNETILFVDDEASIRLVSEDILTGLGYRVVLAENGEEAVNILRDRPRAINLVLIDIAMPVMNGRVAVKLMRMVRPDVKVLFTSGHCDADTIESLHEDGFAHFLAKPFSMLDLQAAVRKTLDASEDR